MEIASMSARSRLAEQLVLRARDLGSCWGSQASNPVQNRGDRLIKIYWKGRQWAATKFGVQCRDGSYSIPRNRLWENEAEHPWIMHMAEKDWIDLEDFAEALRVARILEMCRTGKRPADSHRYDGLAWPADRGPNPWQR
jgi:hypothetical protein